jgi:uncharacterized protein (TIGR03083 family)
MEPGWGRWAWAEGSPGRFYSPVIDPGFYLSQLGRDLDAICGRLQLSALDVSIKHCDGWTLADLAEHLGQDNQWAAAAITELRGDYHPPPPPTDPAALAPWFAETASMLLAALDVDPDSPAWTLWPPHTVAFWQRRRCMETVVHRWDVEDALGVAATIDARVAGDGIAEVFDTMAPRQIALRRAPAPQQAIRVTSETSETWTFGSGEPVATIVGTASDLLLMLWGRIPTDDPRITIVGDRHGAEGILGNALVP